MRTIKARRDTIESQIVDALRACGVYVRRISQKGVPDLLLWREDMPKGCVMLMEVKSPHGRLTAAQSGFQAPYALVRDTNEALTMFGVK